VLLQARVAQLIADNADALPAQSKAAAELAALQSRLDATHQQVESLRADRNAALAAAERLHDKAASPSCCQQLQPCRRVRAPGARLSMTLSSRRRVALCGTQIIQGSCTGVVINTDQSLR
jgi:hypothetical protein